MKREIRWSTEYVVLFGKWLIEKKNEHGYGLLCIHSCCLGLKVNLLLDLTWEDFIHEGNHECKDELAIKRVKNSSKTLIPLSGFIQRYTKWAYENDFYDEDRTIENKIYTNLKTGKVLTTSTLNRELNKYYEMFKSEVLDKTNTVLCFEPLKSSTFEICWGRDMVAKYNYSKKIFILVSKHMGHRTVHDTINLLGIEPNDDVKICYDLYDPSIKEENEVTELLDDSDKLQGYLIRNRIVRLTAKFEELRDKSQDYDVRKDDPKFWNELKNELGLDDEDLNNVQRLLD